ncbi:TetR/AcrR family transcriptional regulator [Amycolatopsis orientalis]|uniref:TetR/AcrR family transcriptional regulator n=1 Tax=Amycolatopsis orientalis TaxID=31958 RepID=UPI00040F4E13|nr:TetR/AcrR family transcriptional regulator [Amycolatopsis orientalis]
MSRRERHRARKRHEIKMAAVRLALASGPGEVTVDAISTAADIAPRTFFNYFSSKEEALTPDSNWTAQELLDLFNAQPADESPLRSLRGVARQIADSYAPSPEELELWQRHPELLTLAQPEDEEEIFPALIDAVTARLGDDSPHPIYPSLLVTSVFGAMHCAARASWSVPGKTVEDLVDEALDLLERGL